MQFYRCKCGRTTSLTSQGVPPCVVCEHCKTTLATSPSGHRDPVPHRWHTRVREGGEVKVFCSQCMDEGPLKEADGKYIREVRAKLDAALLACEPVGGSA